MSAQKLKSGKWRARVYSHTVDTPTAKAMGFLFLRPLHCRKDFSFT